MRINRLFSGLSVAVLLAFVPVITADDDGGGDDGGGDDAYNDGNDDAYHGYNADDDDPDGEINWGKKSMLPRSCINYGGKDVIVFSMFSNSFNQCSDTPDETYYVSVPTFTQAYIYQKELMAEDTGDDWYAPDVSQYVNCVAYNDVYLQIACSSNANGIAVNVYTDNACTKADDDSEINGTFDISDIQVSF
uniref:Uncharacterized protein n=1 Tax=Corethron hystrix TaxID=216773 RepID=A0A6U5GZN7_9STRA|mmetsp:Transcript_28573/g.65332  ORF Transcript_28573/g.65332 Transcript_28573/m.65332 type:complete len:191 (+) Transcript_28573:314-886(+)